MPFPRRDDYPPRRTRSVTRAGRSLVVGIIGLNLLVFGLDSFLLSRGYGKVLLDPSGAVPVVIDEAGVAHAQLMPPLQYFGHFSAATAIQKFQLWRLVTFQFLHANLIHLGFNMLALYFFGPIVEAFWGAGRFVAFYLLCGIAGAGAYLGLWAAHIVVTGPAVPLVGASAGIFGILIAGAVLMPHARVMLLIPPIPMKLRTLALVMVGIGVYTVLWRGNVPGSNAGGEAAHLGGAALGYLLIRHPNWLGLQRRSSDGGRMGIRRRA